MEIDGVTQDVEASVVAPTLAPEDTLPSFIGWHTVKLESSGRVVLPTSFRFAFANRGIIRPYRDRYLNLWNQAGFELTRQEFAAGAEPAVVGNRAKKRFNMSSFEVTLDKQSRFVIPPKLQTAVGLGPEIVLAGSSEAIEIWNEEAWAEELKNLADADLFLDDFEGA